MKLLSYSFLLILSISCAHTRFVEPLNRGELSVGGGFGGPVIDFAGAPIPVPLSSLEVGYGLDTNLTVFAGGHVTSAFYGNIQLDGGLSWKFLDQNKYLPNLTCSPSLVFAYSIDDHQARLWPVLDLNSFWNYGKRNNFFYIGFNNYFDLRNTSAHDQPQEHHWIFSPQIGHTLKGKKTDWRFTTELKFIAPYIKNDPVFVPYKSILGQWGTTGIYLNFSYPIRLKK